jgi:hypothetical protein
MSRTELELHMESSHRESRRIFEEVKKRALPDHLWAIAWAMLDASEALERISEAITNLDLSSRE